MTEPEAERETATRETAMLVEVIEVARGDYRPEITAVGTVRPVRDVVVAPRVGGEIIARAESFTPGGYIAAGETLVRIDPADYENAVAEHESALAQAQAELSVEMGRQQVAERDYALLDQDLPPEQRALVLRAPQLATAEARVAAAQAALDQAELDLERTRVPAPFDALILSRDVDLGSQVSPGESLGRLVGLHAYWVVATVPRAKLRWIQVPDAEGDPASVVHLDDPTGWGPGVHRVGRVDRVIGALDDETRLARVLVAVDDPLARDEAAGQPPMMIGAYVEARIQGRPLEGVVRLARGHVRKEDTVWVMEDGELHVRPVTVVFEDPEFCYIAQGLEDGERVVTTDLATVVDGAPLRLEGDQPAANGDAGEGGEGDGSATGASESGDRTAAGDRSAAGDDTEPVAANSPTGSTE